MVHLNPDESEELMIIYYESLDENDQRTIQLEGKGKESPRWEQVSRALIHRAKEGLNITFNN